MSFQLNASQLFLTFPQCPVNRAWALAHFERLFGSDLKDYIIASERHANGDEHLHCYFKLLQPFRTRNSLFADITAPDGTVYHGNYQGCRSSKNVIKYVTKDENYDSNLDVSELLGGGANRSVIGKKILEGTPLNELVHQYPSLLFGYQKLECDILCFKEREQPCLPPLPWFLPNPWGLVLPSFRNAKQRHYWIFSRKPNLGKTYHFAQPLCREYRAVIATGDLTYWNVSVNTQCLILDDYNRAKLRYDDLNTLCDGSYGFRRSHRGVVQLDKFVVIVLSNQSIKDLYPNMFELLYARFHEKEIF